MKLVIVLSLIAYGYAAKLDRTYLPPANAATAGGSPGSLIAPGQESSFGQQAPGFRESQSQRGGGSFNQASGPSGPAGSNRAPGFGQQSASQSAFGRPGQSGQAGAQPSNVNLPSGSGVQTFGQTQFSQPQQPERAQAAADRNAETLRYDSQNDGETFAYSFETSNGIAADESGVATNGVHAQGGYSYTGDDGQFYKITYTADENGYVPQGDHLPTPPPIPDEIQRSIEENARAAAAGTQEGAYNPDEDNSPVQYQGQGQQQQVTGSNGLAPSGPTPQSQSRPQGPAVQGNRPGFNQPQGFHQGSSQQAFGGQGGNPQGPSTQSRPQGQISGQGQVGYDYSRPQGQGRQPNGNANFIPSGPSKTGSQGRPFQPSQPGSFVPSKSNQGQVQGNAFNQPQRPQSGNQGFRPTVTQGNQGSQFNQNQRPGAPQPSQRPQTFGQQRPGQNNQQPQQAFQGQRGSGLQGGSNNRDGYEYNRPQSTFTSGNQGKFRPQSQAPAGPGPRPAPQGQSPGAFPGQQQGFPGSSGVNRPSGQVPQFSGPKAPQSQQPQRPGPQQPSNPLANQTFNQRQESFEGPRQQPSFSPEEGYKY